MVDHRHQGKGVGRQALSLALEEIRSIPSVTHIEICYVPANQSAQSFYASFGFKEVGIDEESKEMVMRMDA